MVMSGKPFAGRDLIASGLGSHLIDIDRLSIMKQCFSELDPSHEQQIEDLILMAIDGDHRDSTEFQNSNTLAQNSESIKQCFFQDSLSDIFKTLDNEKSAWAIDTHQALSASHPRSLELIHILSRMASKLSFQNYLQIEYRVAYRLLQSEDFLASCERLVDGMALQETSPSPFTSYDSNLRWMFEPLDNPKHELKLLDPVYYHTEDVHEAEFEDSITKMSFLADVDDTLPNPEKMTIYDNFSYREGE